MSRRRITSRRAPTSRTSSPRPQGSRASSPRPSRPSPGPSARRSSSSRRTQPPVRRFSAKQIAIMALVAVVVLAVLGLVIDVVTNSGKIHNGVVMQGVEIGGMTREEAAVVLEEQIGARLSQEPVDLFANEQLASEGANDQTVELIYASTTYQAGQDIRDAQSWRINATTVGVGIDSAELVEKAYKVGRGMDFLTGRLKANLFGVQLSADLVFEQTQLGALESLLSGALGQDMHNADIGFEDGSFVVVPGREGSGVDHEAFTTLLSQAFLGDSRTAVVPMRVIPLSISDEEAALVAETTRLAVSRSVALVYGNEDSWNLDSYTLGSWVRTSVEGEGTDAKLIPWISESLLAEGIYGIIGDRDPGIRPQNARFEVVDDKITVIPGINGTGINYSRVAADLNGILFPVGDPIRDRRVQLSVTTLEPAFTTAHAEELHITDMIATYTTEYRWSTDAKITNIHLAADLINYSLIEPGGIWSFNGTAGECTAARGFQQATAIVEGEYVDEIGGGICQVATTVFNTILESGMPVVERSNHGFYLIAYPAGRDATISWTWPDLKFENETGNWMLLTMSYTDTSITCTLWGTDPGYRVEFESSGFLNRTDFQTKKIDNPDLPKGEERIKQEGVRGRTIFVTRFVYNEKGELIHKTDFRSVYEPETEIIEVGTKEVERPAG